MRCGVNESCFATHAMTGCWASFWIYRLFYLIVHHVALPRSPAIFYRTQPARRRDAKRAAGSPSARLQPDAFVCETPFETSDFRKSNRRWERNRRRVDCGMHATAYACIPDGRWMERRGATIALLFTLGACEDTPRKKSFARLKPRPRDCPRTPVLRRARIPRLTAPSLVCAPQVTPTFADRLGLSEPFGVRSCCWPDSAFQCLGADVVGAVNPLHVRAIRFPPLNDVAARRAP